MDIVAEILSRLPVEPLLRFRCVSKPWCSLIDSPHFIKQHLKRSIETKSNRKLLVSDGHASLHMSSLDDVAVVGPPLMKCPSSIKQCPLVLGSCHGLVLLLWVEDNDVAIWNPSTKKCRILPPVPHDDAIQPSSNTEDFYGFGYDSVHDDYRVVKIIQFHGDHINKNIRVSQVKVYSLKTNTWKNVVTDFVYHLRRQNNDVTPGVLASGALHWISSETKYGNDRSIVAFNLATEEHGIVPMPSFYDEEWLLLYDYLHVELVSLEGSLCICCGFHYEPFSVWVMKDYGVKASWAELLSVPQEWDNQPFDFATPMAFSMDGAKVLLLQDCTKKLIWYDLKHKVFETVSIHGLHDVSRAEVCVQSLVPPGSDGTGNATNQHRGRKSKKQKAIKKEEAYIYHMWNH